MEVITKYKAIDGKEFNTDLECLDHELLIKKVDEIMSPLHPIPKDDGCVFANGGGYIQHDKKILILVRRSLLELCKTYVDHKWIQQTIDDESVDASWVSRLLGDYGINPLYMAWNRFSCIDKNQREWGQPYYANNPEKAKQIQLNA